MPLSVITHGDFSTAHITSRTGTGDIHQEDRDRVSAIHAACCRANDDDCGTKSDKIDENEDLHLATLCKYLVDSLILRDLHGWFSVPVDPIAMGLPNYASVVSSPTDLGTIRKNEDNLTVDETIEGVRRVFLNAIKYHVTPRNPVCKAAKEHLQWFESQWSLLQSIQNEIQTVTIEDLPSITTATCVHSEAYIQCLEKLEEDCDDRVVCFSPLVMQHCSAFAKEKDAYFDGKNEVNSMTRFSKDTVRVVRRAIGAVLKGIETVDNGERACIALVRPPGHHAGVNGFDGVAGGCGFCIVNNVCVGVAEVVKKRPGSKVVIIDFDVHHGNGTEDIVRNCFRNEAIVYISIHLLEKYPGNPENDYFPGSGDEECSRQVLNIPLRPLWMKSKKRKKGDGTRQGVEGFRQGIGQICQRVKEIQPDYVFFSAGFDATAHDEGSTYMGETGVDIKGEDYGEATTIILAACPSTVKVISVLEGGYGKWAERHDRYDRSDLVTSFAHHAKALARFNNV